MKVLMFNASPHERGCTFTGLSEMQRVLEAGGFDCEIFHVGTAPISGCLGCQGCRATGRCVIDDVVNRAIDACAGADGYVFASPVHFASVSGQASSFFDRLFYTGKSRFFGKPAACFVSCRRAGSTAAIDALNKYPTIAAMPLATSTYWSMIHGNTPAEVEADEEGMQTLRNLARNLGWLITLTKNSEAPTMEAAHRTNFIR